MTRRSPRGGIIREARRPAGWIAPGPPPAGPGDAADLQPDRDEDLCFLVGDWRIFQRVDGHRWSTDDLVTADLAARAVGPTPPRRFLDLGCGQGSVLMSIAWRFPDAHGVGVEAQPLSAALCRRSLRYNGAAARVAVVDGDLRDYVPDAPFQLVTGTPPYFAPGTGTESTAVQKAPARFEHRGGVETYIEAAARALAPGAPFVLCAAHAETTRIEAAARAAGLHVHERVDLVPRTGKPPLLVLAVLRREPCPQATPRTLTVRDAAGQWTADFRAVRRAMGLPDEAPRR